MPSYGTRAARNKYGARKTTYQGVLYDSNSEAEEARTLDLLQIAGEIDAWARADTIILIPGSKAWKVAYTPDFRVWGDRRPDPARPELTRGNYLIEVKGDETEAFLLRLKLLRYFHPEVRLLIVKPDGTERWAW